MTAAIQRLTRVFRVSTQTFPDPAPIESPERAFAMLAAAMPALALYTLEAPVVEGEQMVYTATRPPAQTKGAKRSHSPSTVDDTAAALDAWASAPSTAGYDAALHVRVAQTLAALARREPGKVDPFALPMA